jgi:hypothetical protein
MGTGGLHFIKPIYVRGGGGRGDKGCGSNAAGREAQSRSPSSRARLLAKPLRFADDARSIKRAQAVRSSAAD